MSKQSSQARIKGQLVFSQVSSYNEPAILLHSATIEPGDGLHVVFTYWTSFPQTLAHIFWLRVTQVFRAGDWEITVVLLWC